VLLTTILACATHVCNGVVLRGNTKNGLTASPNSYVHLSDMHLDLISDPSQYSPAQFCRNEKDFPPEDRVELTWSHLVADGIAKHDRTFSKAHAANATAVNAALNAAVRSMYDVPFGWQLCDSKPAMVDALLADAAKVAGTPDFVLLTGDWAAHLQLSQNTTLAAVSKGAELLGKHFNASTIVPVIGNNDVFPDYNMTKCYSSDLVGMYLQWYRWIPDSQIDNFLKFGGYETRLHNDKLRIFSINTVFYHSRVKVFGNVSDPCDQLAFLTAGLKQAEADGAQVIITGHIPPKTVVVSPSQAAFYYWPMHQDNILALLHQYSHVITATLWGHSHHDEFWVDTRTDKSGKTTTVAGLMAPSITPLPSYPSYRIGTYDPSTFALLDYEQHSLNLQEANIKGVATVKHLYTFSTTYGYANVSMTTIANLQDQLVNNDSVSASFLGNYYAGYDPDRFETVCSLVSTLEAYWKCRFKH
jgi:hypothetical protein